MEYLLIIGLVGFLFFSMVGTTLVKRNNKVYHFISGLFALLALCIITYDTFFVKWAYVEGSPVWNFVVTVLLTIGYGLIFAGFVQIQRLVSKRRKGAKRSNA